MAKKPKVTINDIARLAQTSKTTVSFYLNGKFDKMSVETKDRIATVIEEQQYRPSVAARSLNAKSMKLIGVLIGDITNDFANQIVKGIDEIAKTHNYQLIVGNSNYTFESESDYIDRMLSMGVDGFIVQPTIQFKALIPKIRANGKSLVFIDSQTDMESNAWVKTNNYEAVLETTFELVDKGYNDFILLTADPSVLSTRMERSRGFTDALTIREQRHRTHIVDYDMSAEVIEASLNEMIDPNRKTLIFAANCWLLGNVFMAVKAQREKIPEQIGLLGFDNLEWTKFASPTVTTIVQPSYEEGKVAASILIDKIEGKNELVPTQILKCDVNWEESTQLKA